MMTSPAIPLITLATEFTYSQLYQIKEQPSLRCQNPQPSRSSPDLDPTDENESAEQCTRSLEKPFLNICRGLLHRQATRIKHFQRDASPIYTSRRITYTPL